MLNEFTESHSLPSFSFFFFKPYLLPWASLLASQDSECRTLEVPMPKRWAREPCTEPGKIGKNSGSDGRISGWARKHIRLENDPTGVFPTKLAHLCSGSGQLGRIILKGTHSYQQSKTLKGQRARLARDSSQGL